MSIGISALSQNLSDNILGRWRFGKGDLIMVVYKQNNEYRAKSVFFNGNTKPMELWTDDKNPNLKLRTRKLLGMDIVSKLHYDLYNKEWVDGIIYDATSGKTWQSVVWLESNNVLKVKRYWIFKFLSKTLTFKRIE